MRQFRFSVGTPKKPTRFMVEDAQDGENKFIRCSDRERLVALLTRLNIKTDLLPGRENTCCVVTQNEAMTLVLRALEDAFTADEEPEQSDRMTNADRYGVGL